MATLNIGQQTFADVTDLRKKNSKLGMIDAITSIAEQRGVSVATVQTAYYREARKHGLGRPRNEAAAQAHPIPPKKKVSTREIRPATIADEMRELARTMDSQSVLLKGWASMVEDIEKDAAALAVVRGLMEE